MLSQSARMNSAAEARFRVQAPNSLPRTITVVALDAAGEALAERLADAAPVIGNACSLRRVMTTGFVIGAASASEPELSKTLAQLRPWSLMVVLARSDDYIDDMMAALRA